MSTRPIRLLLVEDQSQDAQRLTDELELYGLSLITHRVSSDTALASALREPWDIVLCDYMVPDMDWRRTLDSVRKALPYVPVIVVSGQRGEEFAVETMRAGCSDFITKDRLMRLGPSVVRELAAAAEAERLRKTHRQLQRELQRARRLEATGQLAGGLAHNLNNLLTVIMGSLDLARFEQPEGTLSQYLKDAILATERASKMTRQLNQLAAGPSFTPSAVDLNDMIEHLRTLVMPGLPDGITLSVQRCDSLPPVLADPVMLEQAVLNLLLNARDAISDSGHIECAVERRDDRWVISVSDNGAGVAEDLHERIFEPFYSTKGDTGTGLGLSSTYQIMRSHGGSVDVDSARGRGARFELIAPIREAAAITVDSYYQRWQAGHGRVLVVDDAEQVLLTCQAILRQCGYEVETAAGYTEALARLDTGASEPQVIISDSIMSEGSATELLQWLREHGRQTPLIVTSLFASDERHRYGRQQGFAGFLPKPFNAAELSSLVADVRASVSS